jgi:AcrR family transcriptional regulator
LSVALSSRHRRQAQTRAELLDAAARVFARRGYHGATLDEIAAEAGFTSGAVYSNFKGKEELFLALTDQEIEQRLEDFRAVGEAADTPGGTQEAASERFAKFVREDPDWPLLYFEFWAYAARNPGLRKEFSKRRRSIQKTLAEMIERQCAEAGVRLPIAPEHVAVALGALIDGLAFERVIDPDSISDELFGLLISRVLSGLVGSPPETA